MSTNIVYDLETIPDIALGRKLLDLYDADDNEVVQALIERRKQQTQGNSEFLPHYLQRIVAISIVIQSPERIKVMSLGDLESDEKSLIERFFAGLEHYTPTLISWNGSGFDLPVLHYRALHHKITAKRYWENGDNDPNFKWNNYLSRYHYRHLDLMDLLSGFNNRAFAPLHEIAVMLGFPGKLGIDGSQVLNHYQAGNLSLIRNYCETDVLNTYLIFLRFQHMRGHLNDSTLAYEMERVKDMIRTLNQPHLTEFLEAWH